MTSIPYYETSGFVFSNFSAHKVIYQGVTYPTVEHAFHAQKFVDTSLQERIQNCGSPREAWNLARELKPNRRSDWNDVKVEILTDIIRAKVAQHSEVEEALLSTGDEVITEINPEDAFWGAGPDGKGQNQTGKILMLVRNELRN